MPFSASFIPSLTPTKIFASSFKNAVIEPKYGFMLLMDTFSVRGHFLLCYISLVMEKLLAFLAKKAAEQGTIEKITQEAMMASLIEASVTAIPGGRLYLKTGCDKYFDQLCKLMDLEPIRVG